MNNSSLGGVGIFDDRDIKDVPGMSYILLPDHQSTDSTSNDQAVGRQKP